MEEKKFSKYLKKNTKKSEDYLMLKEKNKKERKSLYYEENNVCDRHYDGA